MPRRKESVTSKLQSYVKLCGSDIFSTDGSVLLCKICEREVVADRKSQVTQHLNGAKHRSKLEKKSSDFSNVVQLSTFLQPSAKQSQYSMELCDTFLSADIPLHKLDNEKLKKFLEKWTRQETPAAATLRKGYIKAAYEGKLNLIRSSLSGKLLWVSIDETTDVTGRFVAHTVVGTLGTEGTQSFLLNAECLDKTNSSTIAQAFVNAMLILWPEGILHDRIRLLVSDSAAYMLKAGSALKVIFPNMLHVTCTTHALHRVAEEVRAMFPDVDKLVANGKKTFRKSAARITTFREIAPQTPLPPQPILTRWGTWIKSAVYYAENFEEFESVTDSLDGSDAASIRVVQQLTKQPSLKRDLAFIKAHFGSLPVVIEQLERKGVPLVEALRVFEDFLLNLRRTPGQQGQRICEKCDAVVSRNPDLKVLQDVSKILQGDSVTEHDDRFNPSELASFKYAPITSVDVERSFSHLKHILNDRRQNFTFEHLKQVLIVHCNP